MVIRTKGGQIHITSSITFANEMATFSTGNSTTLTIKVETIQEVYSR